MAHGELMNSDGCDSGAINERKSTSRPKKVSIKKTNAGPGPLPLRHWEVVVVGAAVVVGGTVVVIAVVVAVPEPFLAIPQEDSLGSNDCLESF